VSFLFSSRRRHTRSKRDWSSDVCSSDLGALDDVADLTHDAAADVGVPREIGTIDDYALTATWAAAADDAGFTGLRYFPRFTTGKIGRAARRERERGGRSAAQMKSMRDGR